MAALAGLPAIGSAILGGVASGVVGKMLAPKAKSAPAAPATAVMPTPDDASVQAAKRKRIAEIQGRQGRASTILSDADTLG